MPTGLPSQLLDGAQQPSSLTAAIQVMGGIASEALARIATYNQV
jgi:hypothetical protein